VGSNDGFLHCFVDDDLGDNDGTSPDYSNDELSEAWCFLPWDLIPNLPLLEDGTEHSYFVDGSPLLYNDGGYQYVIFGLRRGGNKYYTLKIGNIDSNGTYTGGYTTPEFSWEIGPDKLILGGGSEELGQSWCKPYVAKLKTGTGSNDYTTALILAGGYDETAEDEIDAGNLPSTLPTSTKGRAIYAVRGDTGALIDGFNATDNASLGMTHSFVDFLAFDRNNNEFTDGIYAGDMGGNLFGFKDRDASSDQEDGVWEAKKVFQGRDADAGTDDIILKFFYSPDAVKMSWGDYVYIGTGDREHPLETSTVNRFYAIQNRWSVTTTMTESDLRDVTAYAYPYDENNGWFIRLEDAGEKVVSAPLVYNNVVYFTTYVPATSSPASADLCAASDIGYGYLYGLEFNTGKAFFNWSTANDTSEGQVIAKDDRRKLVGTGIPTPPTLVVTKEGTQIVTATSEKFTKIDVTPEEEVNRYYWKQY
jgi:type IV pilus assembly protein PilY1